MSDVSALVLTVGEPYVGRAMRSIERQSLPARDVVVVGPSESPFHRAFNAGTKRIRTEFFVQVDADCVLDSDCFAELRARIDDGVSIVAGRLRDPLLGRIGSVRLYRTRCVSDFALPNTIAPDTDSCIAMREAGWSRVDALKRRDGPPDLWHTLGEHRPDYTPLYTFSKFRLLGTRCRYWRDVFLLRDYVAKLSVSVHEAAPLALIGLCRGVFLRDESDRLRPFDRDVELDLARALLAGPSREDDGDQNISQQKAASTQNRPITLTPALFHPGEGAEAGRVAHDVFVRHCNHGAELGVRRDAAGFLRGFESLNRQASEPYGLIALLGLCQGAFRTLADCAGPDDDYALLAGWAAPGSPTGRSAR